MYSFEVGDRVLIVDGGDWTECTEGFDNCWCEDMDHYVGNNIVYTVARISESGIRLKVDDVSGITMWSWPPCSLRRVFEYDTPGPMMQLGLEL
jgi:hypothetical protein